ncbi:MAG: hypothetical protein WCH99_14150 [Verrucomicrobiota bacterium]
MPTQNQNIDNSDTLEIMPLEPTKTKAAEGKYAGRFTNMCIDNTPRRNGSARKDLLITVQVDNPGEGEPAELVQVFNLLSGKRGKSQFKKGISSWIKRDVSDAELNKFSKAIIMDKPVVCSYITNKLGNGVMFDTYLPVEQKPNRRA